MTTPSTKDDLLLALDRAVQETLTYFDGPGRAAAPPGQWGAWDVLAHFHYWHDATAWGIASASLGGPPWQLSGSADTINAAALAVRAAEGFDDLLRQLQQAQARLLHVARTAPDLDAPAFRMSDGRLVSVGQRLETIARHWRGHVAALQSGS
ncbi:MAG: hypothetical protein AB7R89_03580 [Dehalococcoidia bacterium]